MTGEPTAGSALRWGRAAVLAGVVLGFSTAAHAGAGGALPGPVTLSVLALLTTTVLAALLGRPASTARVVSLVVLGQAGMHAVFTAAGGHAGTAQVGAAAAVHLPEGRLAESLDADLLAGRVTPGSGRLGTWVHHLVQDVAAPGAMGMVAAHLAAATLLGLWLAAGERLAWRVLALLTGAAAAVLHRVDRLVRLGTRRPAPTGPPTTTPPSPRWADRATLRRPVLARSLGRRGPPVLS